MLKYLSSKSFLRKYRLIFPCFHSSERTCHANLVSHSQQNVSSTALNYPGSESNEVISETSLSSLTANSASENASLTSENYSDDVSDYAPYHAPSFNFAAYVNKSPLLQQLVNLGVNLAALEKKRWAVETILKLDFDSDVKKCLLFLKDLGISSQEYGQIITKAPLILVQDTENLQVRINYLESKLFKLDQIQRIVSENPIWLTLPTVDIDYRLGFFQQNFDLSGDEVRFVATRMPKLITFNLKHVKLTMFCVNEEMGFNKKDSKTLMLTRPKIYTISRKSLFGRFDYVHNKMGIPHDLLLKQPDPLLNRQTRIRDRHEFLVGLGKAQYNPSQPGYVSLKGLLEGNDSEFCARVAQTSVQTYNKFLKSR